MAPPAATTASTRLTTGFQVSGCACAASIAAAFAATAAGLAPPAGSPPGCWESLLVVTSYFIPEGRDRAGMGPWFSSWDIACGDDLRGVNSGDPASLSGATLSDRPRGPRPVPSHCSGA